MNSRILRHGRIAAAAAVLAAVAAGAACRPDRATVFEPYGPNSYDFHLTNADDIASAGLPQGTVDVAGTDVTVTLGNLHPLASGVYKVWAATVADDQLSNVTALTGDVTVTDAEGTSTTTNGTSTFADGGAGVTVSLAAPVAAGNAFNVVFVSIESSAGATAPSTSIPLWAEIAGDGSYDLTFGNFTAKAASRYAYFINGHGEGGVRGTTLIVDDSSLARPPIGYYYGAFLVNADGSDTLYLGELTAPFPRRSISLRDADASVVDPVVQTNPPLITTASILFDGSKAGLTGTLPYAGWTNFFIALIAKQGVQGALPPNVVTAGTLPAIVTTAPAPAP